MTSTTTATFHLPHSSQAPLELTSTCRRWRWPVLHHDALGQLEGKWTGAIGVYVLLGPADAPEYRA